MLTDPDECSVNCTADRRTILIVTDDGNLVEAASRILEQAGYDVVAAPHAGHAFLAALTRSRIDVLLSDSKLDDMTGERLAATLRRYHRGLRGVFIADRVEAHAAPTLVRPFTREQLLRALAATSQAS
jgi:CheY-like chemotaxis protein